MRKRQVYLFSAQNLLGESIEQTLRGVEGLEICGHWPVDQQVLDRLAGSVPDFVVFADEGASPDALSHLTSQILDQYPDLPVFRVRLERNQMQVFSSQVVPARSANLIDLIQHLPLKRAGLE